MTLLPIHVPILRNALLRVPSGPPGSCRARRGQKQCLPSEPGGESGNASPHASVPLEKIGDHGPSRMFECDPAFTGYAKSTAIANTLTLPQIV
ncbi:hypothetical protein C8Q74DRAFT_1292988 [Fomes fomentarius]|nr:hypothetical protein C8Q74DRAFT_1292865 [Fomes fomentarius]KAI0762987.1 hypothetical protein C8Q74DRAFT_1292988 [Fomes fomentarius]